MATMTDEKVAACSTSDPDSLVFRSHLFDSTSLFDHMSARRYCARCPIVGECLRAAVELANARNRTWQAGPDGTWGGLLWANGNVVDLGDEVVEEEPVEAPGSASAIRAWARATGRGVTARGPIPAHVREAYERESGFSW